MGLNLSRQANVNPKVSAYTYLNRPFDFNATPLAPHGCPVLTHDKPNIRSTWALNASDGWYVAGAMDHYRCFKVLDKGTKHMRISDTVHFKHAYLTSPGFTPADRMVSATKNFNEAIQGFQPDQVQEAQMQAFASLKSAIGKWINQEAAAPPVPSPRVPPRKP